MGEVPVSGKDEKAVQLRNIVIAGVLLAVVGGVAAFAAFRTLSDAGSRSTAAVVPKAGPEASLPATASAETTAAAPAEDTAADRLGALALLAYPEQLASQETLEDLAAGEMAWGEFGEPRLDDAVPAVPVTVGYRNGTVVAGELLLGMTGDRWYFIGVTRGVPPEPAAAEGAVPAAEYAAVVAGLASQEGTAAAGFMARVLDGRGGRVTMGEPVVASGVVEIPGTADDGQRMSLVILRPAGSDRLFLAGVR